MTYDEFVVRIANKAQVHPLLVRRVILFFPSAILELEHNESVMIYGLGTFKNLLCKPRTIPAGPSRRIDRWPKRLRVALTPSKIFRKPIKK